MNLSLIYISGPTHFCRQSLFYQCSKDKNWKSAFPWVLNKEKINECHFCYFICQQLLCWYESWQYVIKVLCTAITQPFYLTRCDWFPPTHPYHRALWYSKYSLPYAGKKFTYIKTKMVVYSLLYHHSNIS